MIILRRAHAQVAASRVGHVVTHGFLAGQWMAAEEFAGHVVPVGGKFVHAGDEMLCREKYALDLGREHTGIEVVGRFEKVRQMSV